jgi:thiamine pyrophosphokinase
MTEWWGFDPGLKDLLLVGPCQQEPLTKEALLHTPLEGLPQIAVDGGIRAARKPFLWTGDGDSGHAPEGLPIIVKTAQDRTDLGFCLEGIRPWRWRELHLAGFLGGRLDHQLANFGEICAEFTRRKKTQSAIFYDERLRPEAGFYPAGAQSLNVTGLFSVLVFAPARLDISGNCRYPAEALALEPLSGQGVSNEGLGEIHIRCDQPFAVIRVFND